MKTEYMNQLERVVQWRISHRTRKYWRWTVEGLKFLQVSGRVAYRLSGIKEY